MRRPTIQRGSLPAVIGIGAVAAGIAVATWIEAASGGAPVAAGAVVAPRASASAGPPGSQGTGDSASADAAGMSVSLPLAGTHVNPATGGTTPWPTSSPTATATAASSRGGQPGSPPRQLVVPDIIAAAPGGINAAEIARISKFGQVRAVLPIDGARITVNGQQVNILSAPASQLRSWMPPPRRPAAPSGTTSPAATSS